MESGSQKGNEPRNQPSPRTVEPQPRKLQQEWGKELLEIPEEYSDLAEVFSEERSDELPPHRATNSAIEIRPRAKLPKPKLYSMSPQELEEMQIFIDKNL